MAGQLDIAIKSYSPQPRLYILQVDYIGNEVLKLPDRKMVDVVLIILSALIAVAKVICEMDELPE